MIVVRDIENWKGPALMATIGFFDGVHLGHRFLINEMRTLAQARQQATAVITFSKHPRAVLHADYQPQLLNTLDERLRQLETTGVDYCIVLDFTIELSRLSACDFITTILSHKLGIQTLLIGYDHRFGHDRSDGFEQYVAYGAACGMQVLQASPYNEGNTTVSSSEIRRLIQIGSVGKAAHLLSYPYPLEGHIVSGYQVGRTLGFPTANIQIDNPHKLLPAIGVYAVWTELQGKRYPGMLYIGNRPTLHNGSHISLEVHILHFSDDIYNEAIRVCFIRYIREDIRFNSLDELKSQLEKDRNTVMRVLSNESN